MTDADIAYYQARLRQEEARAEQAGDIGIASVHRRMAEAYRDKLGMTASREQAASAVSA